MLNQRLKPIQDDPWSSEDISSSSSSSDSDTPEPYTLSAIAGNKENENTINNTMRTRHSYEPLQKPSLKKHTRSRSLAFTQPSTLRRQGALRNIFCEKPTSNQSPNSSSNRLKKRGLQHRRSSSSTIIKQTQCGSNVAVDPKQLNTERNLRGKRKSKVLIPAPTTSSVSVANFQPNRFALLPEEDIRRETERALQAKVDKVMKENKRLTNYVNRVQKRANDLVQEMQKQRLQSAKAENDQSEKYEMEKAEMMKKYSDLQLEYDAERERMKSKREKHEKLETEYKQTNEELREEIDGLRQENDDLVMEIDEILSDQRELSKQLQCERKKNQFMESTINEYKKKLEAMRQAQHSFDMESLTLSKIEAEEEKLELHVQSLREHEQNEDISDTETAARIEVDETKCDLMQNISGLKRSLFYQQNDKEFQQISDNIFHCRIQSQELELLLIDEETLSLNEDDGESDSLCVDTEKDLDGLISSGVLSCTPVDDEEQSSSASIMESFVE